jgi:hypothetical protein
MCANGASPRERFYGEIAVTGRRLRIIVLGYLVRGPLGGLAWHHLQYVVGLHRLGHDVYFLEDSDDYPACYDPARGVTDTDPSYGLRFAAEAFTRLGLANRWAYHDAHTGRWLGPCAEQAPNRFLPAEIVLNVSGVNPLRPWLNQVPVRVLIDTDPLFTQVRHLTDPAALELAQGHTAFFTFGENLARGTSAVPSDGLPWQATRQPIVLDLWPVTAGPAGGRFTSVMQWDSYPAREYGGQRYGMKAESFGPYADLPRDSGEILELAVGSASAPRPWLAGKGWVLQDPLYVTRDPWTYQAYIRGSKAEFGVAKHGYVRSRSGWFSERSAAYLASGRPVVVQDTGFTEWLPAGAGVLAFRTPDEARARIQEVSAAYQHHCQAARDVAERCFDSRCVLPLLLESALAGED